MLRTAEHFWHEKVIVFHSRPDSVLLIVSVKFVVLVSDSHFGQIVFILHLM